MSATASPGKNSGSDSAGMSSFLPELFKFGLYKPTQGRIVRQVTFFSVALLTCLAIWELHTSGWFNFLNAAVAPGEVAGPNIAKLLFSFALAGVGMWIAYRLVNFPAFADFMIAVEAEMNKVSWPTRDQLYRASVVVIFVIFAMAVLLFVFDILWTAVFEMIGIRYSEADSWWSKVKGFLGF
jgi:preprotein translocase subunit SecE